MMSSPNCPPLASWAKVVITYLLSDFRGLWQAMQFSTRIGATSRMKLRDFAAGAPPAFFSAGAAFFSAWALGASPRANGTRTATDVETTRSAISRARTVRGMTQISQSGQRLRRRAYFEGTTLIASVVGGTG